MAVSRHLQKYAYTISGKGQWIVRAYAKALEVVPRQVAENAGLDSTEIITKLRQKHAENEARYGVDVIQGDIMDTLKAGIWEPSDNKKHSFQAATEAACVILSIDETVTAAQSQDPGAQQATGMLDGGGAPMTNMMNNAMGMAQGGAPSGQLAPGVSYMKGRGGR